jgi:4-aminobutyrate aminotransferase-like enzyme
MDQRTAATRVPDPDAAEFIRFCYRRRRVGWPELYDEMCAVAGRGLYHGYTVDDLSVIGVGLTLFEMPAMAAIVHRVVDEDQERRRRSVHAIRAAHAERVEASAAADATEAMPTPKLAVAGETAQAESGQTDQQPRFVPVAAGA